MNELLAARYSEVVDRLAAGIEPRDALRGGRARGAAVTLVAPAGRRAARPLAHAGGRWSIRYAPGLPASVDLRIGDSSRRYVARLIRFPIVPLAGVLAAEAGGGHVGASRRTWRPQLYPGAAYPLAASATGIRGRVLLGLNGPPARWARVEAGPVDGPVLWRAHGDDRGEFLLSVGPDPQAPADLPDKLMLSITVYLRQQATVGQAPDPLDPWWDLPVESVSPPEQNSGPDGSVSLGTTLPPGYSGGLTATHVVELIAGRIASDVSPFVLD